MNSAKIFWAATLAVLGTLLWLGLSVSGLRDTFTEKPQPGIVSSVSQLNTDKAKQTSSYSSISDGKSGSLAIKNVTQIAGGASRVSHPYVVASQPDSNSTQSRSSVSALDSWARQQPEGTSFGSQNLYFPHMPFVFLDLNGVLPVTSDVAAAVHNIQQDFINSTGAGTADPADPGYARAWEWAQPTADEEFYTLFGGEAYSAMLNEQIHELGHL